jgi:hypothetical protein
MASQLSFDVDIADAVLEAYGGYARSWRPKYERV